jgi:hypothetical protein
VLGLIAAHKRIMETVRATAAEIRHSTEDEAIALEKGVFTEQNSDELDLFVELTEAVPTTLLGVIALVTHLDEVNKTDPWKFEDNYATPLIGALATAFNRMAVAHRVELFTQSKPAGSRRRVFHSSRFSLRRPQYGSLRYRD